MARWTWKMTRELPKMKTLLITVKSNKRLSQMLYFVGRMLSDLLIVWNLRILARTIFIYFFRFFWQVINCRHFSTSWIYITNASVKTDDGFVLQIKTFRVAKKVFMLLRFSRFFHISVLVLHLKAEYIYTDCRSGLMREFLEIACVVNLLDEEIRCRLRKVSQCDVT